MSGGGDSGRQATSHGDDSSAGSSPSKGGGGGGARRRTAARWRMVVIGLELTADAKHLQTDIVLQCSCDTENMPHKGRKHKRSHCAKGKDDLPGTSADAAVMRGSRSPSQLTVETYTPADDEQRDDTAAHVDDEQQVDKDGQPLTDKIRFFTGNPRVEKTTGILHLYRYNGLFGAPEASADDEADKSRTLCLLAVPAWMTCRELLQFLAQVSADIAALRIIRDTSPNRYMALVTFRSQASADEFYAHYNGTQYNSIEPDVCNLVYVRRVEITRESQDYHSRGQSRSKTPAAGGKEGTPLSSGRSSDCTELPTCPVCLERMDESVDGILTILCNHAFHGRCLSQWSDPTCPVCRQCQTPELQADQSCAVCSRKDDLWICLICGHVGCGRYAMAHAHEHFRATMHTFSLQVGGNRVWDYAGDNYVHRLLLSKEDGKLVEYEPVARDADNYPLRVENSNTTTSDDNETAAGGGGVEEGAAAAGGGDRKRQYSFDRHDPVYLEQRESMQLEFTKLLSTQLESQRRYFEEKLLTVEKLAAAQLEDVERQVSQLSDECGELRQAVRKLDADKTAVEKRHSQCAAKLKQATSERDEEKHMNACLRADHEGWKRQVDELNVKLEVQKRTSEATIGDLSEQVRDLMFHFDAEAKLRAAAEKAAGSANASPTKRGADKDEPNAITQEELLSGQLGVVPSPLRRHKKKK